MKETSFMHKCQSLQNLLHNCNDFNFI
jgi:hypothetical protein